MFVSFTKTLKLYQLIKGKTAAPSEASVEPPKE